MPDSPSHIDQVGSSAASERAGSGEPGITFAIPFYEGLDYLRVAIESVRAQDHEGWRLVVCDDSGRETGAEDLVLSYGDDRMQYHRNAENLGMVANWNLCLERAPTDLVNLLHGDDALLPNYASLMLGLARQHPEAAMFYCRTEIIGADGRTRFSMADWIKRFIEPAPAHDTSDADLMLHGEAALRDLMAGYFIMTPCLCYQKSRLGGRRFDGGWKQVQDLIFTTGLLLEGATIVGSREVAYAYRRHDASATSVQSESMLRFDEEIEAFDLIAERARARGWHEAARVARRKRIVKLHLGFQALREAARLRWGTSFATLRYLAKHL